MSGSIEITGTCIVSHNVWHIEQAVKDNNQNKESTARGSVVSINDNITATVAEDTSTCISNESSQFNIQETAVDKPMTSASLHVKAQAPVVMFKWGSKGNRFRCQVCDMSFKSGDELKVHFVKHEVFQPSTPFSCNICRKSFASQASFLRHRRMHMGVTMKKCKYCHKAFANKENLEKHMKDHAGLIKCHLCSSVFSCKFNLATHMATHQNLRQFVCDICNKGFNRKDTLLRHEIIHRSERERKYQCVECGKSYMNEYLLKRHTRSIHSDEPLGATCEVCNKFIRNRENLKRHMLTHSDRRDYKCDVCGFAFKQKAHLNEHRAKHEPEKNFKCDLCEWSCKTRRSLNRHRSLHKSSPENPESLLHPAENSSGVSSSNKKQVYSGCSNSQLNKDCKKLVKCNICFSFVNEMAITKHIEQHESKGEMINIKKGYTEFVSKGTNTGISTDKLELETIGSIEGEGVSQLTNRLRGPNCLTETNRQGHMAIKSGCKKDDTTDKKLTSDMSLLHSSTDNQRKEFGISESANAMTVSLDSNHSDVTAQKYESDTIESPGVESIVVVDDLGKVVYYLYDGMNSQGPVNVSKDFNDGPKTNTNVTADQPSIVEKESEKSRNLFIIGSTDECGNKSKEINLNESSSMSADQKYQTVVTPDVKENDIIRNSAYSLEAEVSKSKQIQTVIEDGNGPNVEGIGPTVVNGPQEEEQTYVIHIQDREGSLDFTEKNKLLQSIIDYAASIQ